MLKGKSEKAVQFYFILELLEKSLFPQSVHNQLIKRQTCTQLL